MPNKTCGNNVVLAGRWQGKASGGDRLATKANQQLVHQPEEAQLAQQLPVCDVFKVKAQKVERDHQIYLDDELMMYEQWRSNSLSCQYTYSSI